MGARPARRAGSGRPLLPGPLGCGARDARGLAWPVGQRDLEARTDARLRADADLAAEQRHVVARDGEPESHAVRALRSPVDLMEGLEDRRQVLARDAGAGVLDAEDDAPLARDVPCAHRDRTLARELDRVVHQVVEDDAELGDVGLDLGQRGVAPPAQRDARGHGDPLTALEVADEGGEAYGLDLEGHLARLELAEVEQTVDELEEALRRLADTDHHLITLRARPPALPVAQPLRVRPQYVKRPPHAAELRGAEP